VVAALLRDNGGPVRLPFVLYAQDDVALVRRLAATRRRASFASLLLQVSTVVISKNGTSIYGDIELHSYSESAKKHNYLAVFTVLF
jgi:hypothetical protein